MSGERGPSGLPVSVMSFVHLFGLLIPIPVMPLDPFLFHPGASWPTGPYWTARNQRREGNCLPLMSPKYGHRFVFHSALVARPLTPYCPRARNLACGQFTRLHIPAGSAPSTPPQPPHIFSLPFLREDPGSPDWM